jgi:basic membrane lipoprotein Med (substrate-binding protein (PBP1-ABC) superfamily)
VKLGIHRGGWLIAAVAAISAVVAGLVIWLAWPSAPSIPGADRVRQFTNVRACMLTGPDGVANSVAAAAWAGLQGASGSSRAMVSYLPVPGPATKATAVPYLASLVQRQCTVIVAVGQAQVAAATSQAARYGHVRFIVITPGAGVPAGSGVVRVSSAPTAHVHQAVQAAVSAAVNG